MFNMCLKVSAVFFHIEEEIWTRFKNRVIKCLILMADVTQLQLQEIYSVGSMYLFGYVIRNNFAAVHKFISKTQFKLFSDPVHVYVYHLQLNYFIISNYPKNVEASDNSTLESLKKKQSSFEFHLLC